MQYAHVFLGFKNGQGFRRVLGCNQYFNELFGYGFGSFAIAHGVKRNNAAERGGRVGLEGFAVGFQAVRTNRYTAWVGVFDDDAGGYVK